MTPLKGRKATEHSVSEAVEYTYAYDGSRLSKTVGSSKKDSRKTEYLLNGSMILAEKTGDETLHYYYSAEGKLLEIGYQKGDAQENHYIVIRNAMGDVAALYTADGILVGSYEYDPYGKVLSETPNPDYTDSDEILYKNPFRYRGYYYDRETGWYYLQSRYYDPEVKRFINADSTDLLTTDCVNVMQYNLFMYCNGNPIGNLDLNGYISIKEIQDSIREWSITHKHPIIVSNVSYSAGMGAYITGGFQEVSDPLKLIYDPLHASGYQTFYGSGVMTGEEVGAGASVGIIFAYSNEDISGFGVEQGIDFGAGNLAGVGIWKSGDDDKAFYGGYLSFGAGEGLGTHLTVAESTEPYYLDDLFDDPIDLLAFLFRCF